jgi:uncharacterized protein
MTNANISVVQSLYAAFGRGEIAAIVNAMTPDAPWTVTGRRSDYPLLGTRAGQAGVQEFFATLNKTQEAKEFTQREFYAVDDKVFVLGHYTWTIRKNGRTADSDFIHIFTVRNGKVVAFLEFTDTAAFAEAYRGG